MHLSVSMLQTVLILGPFGENLRNVSEFANRIRRRFVRKIYTMGEGPNYRNAAGRLAYTGQTRATGISLLRDRSLPYIGIRRSKYFQKKCGQRLICAIGEAF